MGLNLSEMIENFFYRFDSQNYWLPEHYGLKGEEFIESTSNGHQIAGLVMPGQAEGREGSRGTVLFFHSGEMNLQYALPQVAYLSHAGFTIILFDYKGAGKSTGKTSINHFKEDGQAVLLWMQKNHLSIDSLVFYGQGLGCDAALQVIEAFEFKPAGVILESPYCTRRGWIRHRWGPLIGDIASRFVNFSAVEPRDVIQKITSPLLMIYPSKDSYVSKSEKREMLEVLPKKAIVWDVKGCQYLGIFGGRSNAWHDEMIQFLAKSCFKEKHSK